MPARTDHRDRCAAALVEQLRVSIERAEAKARSVDRVVGHYQRCAGVWVLKRRACHVGKSFAFNGGSTECVGFADLVCTKCAARWSETIDLPLRCSVCGKVHLERDFEAIFMLVCNL
jgi:hypothetical protein